MPRRGHRCDRRLPPGVERERRSALRDEQTDGRAGGARPRACRRVPRLLGCGSRVRPEHDGAQLPLDPGVRAHAPRRGRGRRNGTRPRCERIALARARPRSGDRRPSHRPHGGSRARLRRPGQPPLRTNTGRWLSRGGELRGHRPARSAHRRARAFRRCFGLGRRRPLRAPWSDRRRRLGRRRPRLLAVQVLRAAPWARVRQARAAGVLARVQGSAGRRRSGRAPLRARNIAARAPRGLRRSRRVRRLARLGRDPGARACSRRPVPRRAARADRALRPSDDGGARSDVLLQRPGSEPLRGRDVPGRARHRRLARELLRARDDALPRPRGRRRPGRHRALQHGRRGRPLAGRAQEIGLAHGLVDNKSCSIDDRWQALRFVYRLTDRR